MNETLRVGIIGFGRIGTEHAGWIRAAGLKPVATADVTPARRALAESMSIAAVTSVDELLARSDIDAVLVTTPTSMHFEHASAAIAAGKPVMIDKPVTLDLPQAVELRESAAQRGVTISVFHNRRWDIDYLTVLAAVRSGVFGKLINVESRLGQWGSCVGPAAKEYRPGWRNEASFGGGGLYDWGSHFIDQLWQLMLPARPVSVFAQLRGNVWTADCDDFARVCINFDSGAVGMVEINTTTTAPLPRWHIDGTLGSADAPYSLSFDSGNWADLKFTAPDGTTHLIAKPAAGLSEADIWRAFASSVEGNGEPAVTLSSAIQTMTLLDAARLSSTSHASVQLRDLRTPPHL